MKILVTWDSNLGLAHHNTIMAGHSLVDVSVITRGSAKSIGSWSSFFGTAPVPYELLGLDQTARERYVAAAVAGDWTTIDEIEASFNQALKPKPDEQTLVLPSNVVFQSSEPGVWRWVFSVSPTILRAFMMFMSEPTFYELLFSAIASRIGHAAAPWVVHKAVGWSDDRMLPLSWPPETSLCVPCALVQVPATSREDGNLLANAVRAALMTESKNSNTFVAFVHGDPSQAPFDLRQVFEGPKRVFSSAADEWAAAATRDMQIYFDKFGCIAGKSGFWSPSSTSLFAIFCWDTSIALSLINLASDILGGYYGAKLEGTFIQSVPAMCVPAESKVIDGNVSPHDCGADLGMFGMLRIWDCLPKMNLEDLHASSLKTESELREWETLLRGKFS